MKTKPLELLLWPLTGSFTFMVYWFVLTITLSFFKSGMGRCGEVWPIDKIFYSEWFCNLEGEFDKWKYYEGIPE